jgi:hypothetical protein
MRSVLPLTFVLIAAFSARDPVVQGKRVSRWYSQLCYGVYGGRSKADNRLFVEAYAAFQQMGSEPVPYLSAKLHYIRSERVELAYRWAIKQPILRSLLRYTIGPTEKRTYAAVALRQIGPPAEAAIPALLEAWKHDCPEVKLNCLHAIASILYGAAPDGLSLVEGKEFEAKVLAEAGRRYPAVVRDLGLRPEISP